jgi:hypothetical protein
MRSDANFSLHVAVKARQVLIVMVGITLTLCLLSLAANVMWIEKFPGSGTALALFSVDREMSLPTWWSTLVLAGLGLVTWLVSVHQVKRWRQRAACWALAGGFLFLSADEALMLHERLGGKVSLKGGFHHARWILVWLPAALLAAVVVLGLLWQTSSSLVVGIVVGMTVFLSGAVGLELLNSNLRYQAEQRTQVETAPDAMAQAAFVPNDWRRERVYYPYMLSTTAEECLEMLGAVIWMGALMRFQQAPGTSSASKPVRATAIGSGRSRLQPTAP